MNALVPRSKWRRLPELSAGVGLLLMICLVILRARFPSGNSHWSSKPGIDLILFVGICLSVIIAVARHFYKSWASTAPEFSRWDELTELIPPSARAICSEEMQLWTTRVFTTAALVIATVCIVFEVMAFHWPHVLANVLSFLGLL